MVHRGGRAAGPVRKDAARAVRASDAALDKALTSGPGLKVLADLLDTTD